MSRMSEVTTPKLEKLHMRAALPRYVRIAAGAFLFAVVTLGLAVFFLRDRPSEFRMKAFPTKLSKDVVAVVDGYERRESDGNVVKYLIRADRATTYSDNHQELENVYLEVYDEAGERFDKITSGRAVYIPQAERSFSAYFAGDVDITTRDGLRIRTAQIAYDKSTDTAEAEERVEFEREEFRGSSVGASVRIKEQRMELLQNVEFGAVAATGKGELEKNRIDSFKGSSSKALIDQVAGIVRLSENVKIRVNPQPSNTSLKQPSEMRSQSATAYFTDKEVSRIELSGEVELEQFSTGRLGRRTKTRSTYGTAMLDGEMTRYELKGDVEIRTASENGAPTVMRAGIASYEKQADRFDLKEQVGIVTKEGDRAVEFKGEEGTYEQGSGKVMLKGGAEIQTQVETVSASVISAQLGPDRSIRSAVGSGNAKAAQRSPERTIEVSGNELNAAFDQDQRLKKASASGNPVAILVPAVETEYSKVTVVPATAVEAVFSSGGILQGIATVGRTTIELSAPANRPDGADKRLSADAVKTTFGPDGKNLLRAEAVGKAELGILPRQASAENYITNISAPSFNCEFFDVGNNARTCGSGLKTRTVRTPTVAVQGRGEQVLTADRLTATFDQGSQDIDTLEAAGNAKFTESDRNGASARIVFKEASGIATLRDGQPTVWDSRGRARAREIDIDTRKNTSTLRGAVSTTYYNQRQLNGAVPFSNPAPVFATSDSAEFLTAEEKAVYSGNARVWQGNNFLRGDRIEISQREQKVTASGNVQSLLFDARKDPRQNGVPVFGSGQMMTYEARGRKLTYEKGVELRQGSDRIAGEKLVAVLDDRGELVQAVANEHVMVSQPGRKASGEYAQYDVAADTVVMRGSPVRVDDSTNGSTEAAELTISLRDRRVDGEGRTKTNSSGRIRSVYKVPKNQ